MAKEWHGDDIDTEDIVLEAEHNEPPQGGDADKKVADLTAKLAEALAEKQANLDGWQRAKADYVNLLKRFETETASASVRGSIAAVEALLPALDALERAKEHGEVPEGFVAIARQLEGGFASLGLVPLGAAGEAFDPMIHEAIGQDAADSVEKDNTVTVVLEKGWKVGERVVRPAKVRVAHYS